MKWGGGGGGGAGVPGIPVTREVCACALAVRADTLTR